jgi:hypothetical protein
MGDILEVKSMLEERLKELSLQENLFSDEK